MSSPTIHTISVVPATEPDRSVPPKTPTTLRSSPSNSTSSGTHRSDSPLTQNDSSRPAPPPPPPLPLDAVSVNRVNPEEHQQHQQRGNPPEGIPGAWTYNNRNHRVSFHSMLLRSGGSQQHQQRSLCSTALLVLLVLAFGVVLLSVFLTFPVATRQEKDVRTRPALVEVRGKVLFVDGNPFEVRGVNFSPLWPGVDARTQYPHGDVMGDSTSTFPDGMNDQYHDYCDFHLSKIAQAGFNTIRVYNWLLGRDHTAFLDLAHKHGLKVIVTFWMDSALYPDLAKNPELALKNFRHMVRAYKRHPAVLLWAIGNEPNLPSNPLSFSTQLRPFFFLMRALREVRDQEESGAPFHPHPMMVPLADFETVKTIAENDLAAFDVWGVQLYRGVRDLDSILGDIETEKPILVSEFGMDSYIDKKYPRLVSAFLPQTVEERRLAEKSQTLHIRDMLRVISKYLTIKDVSSIDPDLLPHMLPFLVPATPMSSCLNTTTTNNTNLTITNLNVTVLRRRWMADFNCSQFNKLIGWVVFEWNDEWWKGPSDDLWHPDCILDDASKQSACGYGQKDFGDDGRVNEEHLGLTWYLNTTTGEYRLVPKPVYCAMAKFNRGSAQTSEACANLTSGDLQGWEMLFPIYTGYFSKDSFGMVAIGFALAVAFLFVAARFGRTCPQRFLVWLRGAFLKVKTRIVAKAAPDVGPEHNVQPLTTAAGNAEAPQEQPNSLTPLNEFHTVATEMLSGLASCTGPTDLGLVQTTLYSFVCSALLRVAGVPNNVIVALTTATAVTAIADTDPDVGAPDPIAVAPSDHAVQREQENENEESEEVQVVVEIEPDRPTGDPCLIEPAFAFLPHCSISNLAHAIANGHADLIQPPLTDDPSAANCNGINPLQSPTRRLSSRFSSETRQKLSDMLLFLAIQQRAENVRQCKWMKWKLWHWVRQRPQERQERLQGADMLIGFFLEMCHVGRINFNDVDEIWQHTVSITPLPPPPASAWAARWRWLCEHVSLRESTTRLGAPKPMFIEDLIRFIRSLQENIASGQSLAVRQFLDELVQLGKTFPERISWFVLLRLFFFAFHVHVLVFVFMLAAQMQFATTKTWLWCAIESLMAVLEGLLSCYVNSFPDNRIGLRVNLFDLLKFFYSLGMIGVCIDSMLSHQFQMHGGLALVFAGFYGLEGLRMLWRHGRAYFRSQPPPPSSQRSRRVERVGELVCRWLFFGLLGLISVGVCWAIIAPTVSTLSLYLCRCASSTDVAMFFSVQCTPKNMACYFGLVVMFFCMLITHFVFSHLIFMLQSIPASIAVGWCRGLGAAKTWIDFRRLIRGELESHVWADIPCTPSQQTQNTASEAQETTLTHSLPFGFFGIFTGCDPHRPNADSQSSLIRLKVFQNIMDRLYLRDMLSVEEKARYQAFQFENPPESNEALIQLLQSFNGYRSLRHTLGFDMLTQEMLQQLMNTTNLFMIRSSTYMVPVHNETVLWTTTELDQDDILLHLVHLYPAEWKHFCHRVFFGAKPAHVLALLSNGGLVMFWFRQRQTYHRNCLDLQAEWAECSFDEGLPPPAYVPGNPDKLQQEDAARWLQMQMRLWASLRGQTLVRTLYGLTDMRRAYLDLASVQLRNETGYSVDELDLRFPMPNYSSTEDYFGWLSRNLHAKLRAGENAKNGNSGNNAPHHEKWLMWFAMATLYDAEVWTAEQFLEMDADLIKCCATGWGVKFEERTFDGVMRPTRIPQQTLPTYLTTEAVSRILVTLQEALKRAVNIRELAERVVSHKFQVLIGAQAFFEPSQTRFRDALTAVLQLPPFQYIEVASVLEFSDQEVSRRHPEIPPELRYHTICFTANRGPIWNLYSAPTQPSEDRTFVEAHVRKFLNPSFPYLSYRRQVPLKIGEPKSENQNNMLSCARGEVLHILDMNQDAYYSEGLKLPVMLLMFQDASTLRANGFQLADRMVDNTYQLVGFREHIFTHSHSAVARYMALTERAFATLNQRPLAHPHHVRMHYGHPDMANGFLMRSTGGVSRGSRRVNLNEDVFLGYWLILAGYRIDYHEGLSYGKGREASFMGSTVFQKKLAVGAAMQCSSRELYDLYCTDKLSLWQKPASFFGTMSHFLASYLMDLCLWLFTIALTFFAVAGVGQVQFGLNGSHLANLWLFQIGFVFISPMMVQRYVEPSVGRLGFVDMVLSIPFFTHSLRTTAAAFGTAVRLGYGEYVGTARALGHEHTTLVTMFIQYSGTNFIPALELLLCVAVSHFAGGAISLFWAVILAAFCLIAAPALYNPNPTVSGWKTESQQFFEWLGGDVPAQFSSLSPSSGLASWWMDQWVEYLARLNTNANQTLSGPVFEVFRVFLRYLAWGVIAYFGLSIRREEMPYELIHHFRTKACIFACAVLVWLILKRLTAAASGASYQQQPQCPFLRLHPRAANVLAPVALFLLAIPALWFEGGWIESLLICIAYLVFLGLAVAFVTEFLVAFGNLCILCCFQPDPADEPEGKETEETLVAVVVQKPLDNADVGGAPRRGSDPKSFLLRAKKLVTTLRKTCRHEAQAWWLHFLVQHLPIMECYQVTFLVAYAVISGVVLCCARCAKLHTTWLFNESVANRFVGAKNDP